MATGIIRSPYEGLKGIGFQLSSNNSPYSFTVDGNVGLLFGKRNNNYILALYDVWSGFKTILQSGTQPTISVNSRDVTISYNDSGAMAFTFITLDRIYSTNS